MTVICDIDGTLLRSGIYPIKSVIQHVNALRPVVLITGRPESQRQKTVQALHAAGVKYTRLLMAPNGVDPVESKMVNAKKVSGATMAIDNDATARAGYAHMGLKTLDPATIKG